MGATAGASAVGRRSLMGGLVCAGLVTGFGARAATLPEDRLFTILRKGEPIGTHEVRFAATARGLQVRHGIRVAVKLAFVTVYRFAQDVEDLWRDDRLVATDALTEENGERTEVRVRERGGRLVCEGPAGVYDAPLGTMHDLSYWNLAIVRQRGVIDTQQGSLEPLTLRPGGLDEIELAGRAIRARRWRIEREAGRSGEVWYDEAGRIVRAVVRTRGEVLHYQLKV